MADPRADGWMPDLCRLPRLAMMFVVAELVVLVLVLSPDDSARSDFGRFASASGFALWLALTIAATAVRVAAVGVAAAGRGGRGGGHRRRDHHRRGPERPRCSGSTTRWVTAWCRQTWCCGTS